MANTVVKMPHLGESVAEGTLGRWLKQPGDRVERDEALVEVQTDKVNTEVPSPTAGVLQRILMPEGATVAVASDIAIVGDESVEAAPPAAAPGAGGDGQATPGSGGPASPASEPPASGPLSPGSPASEPPAGDPLSPAAASEAVPAAGQPAPQAGQRLYTPVVLALAEEHGLDLETVAGSGLGGRVTRQDVERAIAAAAGGSAPPPAPAAAPPPPPSAWAPPAAADSRALSPMRRAIADHMTRARAEIPDAWSMVEIDVTGLVRQRAELLPEWQAREGFELTYLPFFIKAVLAGLRAVPELNATWSGDRIVVHGTCTLGIAVSVEHGLLVPALRDADQLSVAGLARTLRQIVGKARAGRLAAEDLAGATFTVNNPGSLGSVLSQPIVPIGQAGIVTMEAIVKRPVVVGDDAVAVRSVMNACLSFDHRVLDGAQALRFLRTVKQELETVRYPVY